MWQRFTERARRVILLGQEEAGKMNSGHVGTEHLLLGLVRENEGVAAQVLTKMGVSLAKVRTEIEGEVQPGNDPTPGEPKLTPKAKRVLELAADEARRMRHNYIGTEHLLLALLREKDGLAATVLRRLGLNLEKARAQVMEYLGSDVPGDESPAIPSMASPTGQQTPEDIAAQIQAAAQMDAVAGIGYSPAALSFLVRVAQDVLDGGGSQIGISDLLKGLQRELAAGRAQIIEKPDAPNTSV